MSVVLAYNFLTVEDCEDAWNESVDADVTASADSSDKMVGAASAKFVVAAGASAGDILATEAITKNLTGYTYLAFWVKSSVATAAGDLQILLDDTASCASPLESLNVPALTAGKWTRATVALSTPASLGSLISVGVKMVVDLGGFSLWLDQIDACTAYSFSELSVKGLDSADALDYWNDLTEDSIDGTIYENELLFRRVIKARLALQSLATEANFLNTWWRKTDKEIVYNGDGVKVARTSSQREIEWYRGVALSKVAELTVREKEPRSTNPPSWV